MNKRMPIYNEMSGHFDDTYVSRHHESDLAIHRIVQRGAPGSQEGKLQPGPTSLPRRDA